MSTILPPPSPPFRRPTYREGMLLEAEDFLNEQSYHRGRLAEVLALLHGTGTAAGLRVEHDAANPPEQIKVRPGVAVDGLGRVLEVSEDQCLRVKEWFDFVAKTQPALKAFTDPAKPNERWLIADVFLHYHEHAEGLRPAFPEAAADALDAVVPHRLVETARVKIVPQEGGSVEPPLPVAIKRPENATQLLEAILNAYPPKPTEDVLLARLRVRLMDGGGGFARHGDATITVQNEVRPLLPSAALILSCLKLA